MSLESLSNDKFVQPLSSAEKQILTGGVREAALSTWTAGLTFPIPDGEVDVDGEF